MTASGRRLHQTWPAVCLAVGSAFFHIAAVEPGIAAEVKIGGRALSFDAPSGYCLFDKNRLIENKVITVARRMYEPTEILVWAFAECATRSQWFDQSKPPNGRSGSLFVTKREAIFRAAETMTRSEFVSEMARTQAWSVIYQDHQKRARALDPSIRLNAINVLGKDDTALYVGVTYSVSTKQGRITIVTVNAVTVVNFLPVNMDLSAVGGQYSISDLLAEQKARVRALIARNEQDAGRSATATPDQQRADSLPRPAALATE